MADHDLVRSPELVRGHGDINGRHRLTLQVIGCEHHMAEHEESMRQLLNLSAQRFSQRSLQAPQ
mgnify:CR=1 FL=1